MPVPQIIASSTVAGSGPTRQTLWLRLARELGRLHLTQVSTTATHGEAARVILGDELRDDEAGYDYLPNPWVYVYSGAQSGMQRRALRDDARYVGNYGALTLSRPFAAAVTAGSQLAISSPLPIKAHLGVKGVIDFVGEGLERLWVVARLAFTGNATYSYDLAAYPWLTQYEQTRGIYDTRFLSSTQPPRLSSLGYRISTNGVTRALIPQTLYNTSETFYLEVLVRGDRLVYDGASWSYLDTPGVTDDTYQVAADIEHVVAIGMAKALAYLMELTEEDESLGDTVRARRLARYQRRRAVWGRAAANVILEEMPTPLPEVTDSMVSGAYVGGPSDWVTPARDVPLVS